MTTFTKRLKKTAKIPKPVLIGFMPLLKSSWSEWRLWWRPLILLAAVVGIPVAVASTFLLDTGSDSALSAYLTLAQLIMNTALIYAVFLLRVDAKRQLSPGRVYYDSSVVLVRIILTTALLGLLALPLLLGVLIIAYGIVLPGVALGAGEQALIILLSLLALVPGFYVITRSWASIYVLFESPDGPIASLRMSWRLTKGVTTGVFNRLFGLAGLTMLVLIVPTGILLFSQNYFHSNLFGFALQLMLSLLVLPFTTLYLTKLYQELPR